MAARADEVKLIVDGRVPVEWVDAFPATTPIALQPEGNKAANVELALAAAKNNPARFRASLRKTHKSSACDLILVVCVVAEELDGFARPDVDVVCVGIGPVEAALGTLRALAAKPYALAINAGIAGGFAGRAPIGSAVAVTVERYLEIGREDGGAIVLPPGVRVEATCAADAGLLERYRSRLPKAVFGTGITSATITTSAARSAELATRATRPRPNRWRAFRCCAPLRSRASPQSNCAAFPISSATRSAAGIFGPARPPLSAR